MDVLHFLDGLRLPDYFYDINIISVTFRLFLAMLFSGIIGLERGANRHPAGFRTHILVCLGATLAMLTDQYIHQNLSSVADPARLGAQVITGVGFLGIGIIFVTGKHRIKGLTTAAGLWASACLGLALGIGFYSGAVITGILIFICLALLPRLEHYFYHNARIVNLYIEVDSIDNFKSLLAEIKNMDINIFDTHVSSTGPIISTGAAFHLSVKLAKSMKSQDLINTLTSFEGVVLLEEL